MDTKYSILHNTNNSGALYSGGTTTDKYLSSIKKAQENLKKLTEEKPELKKRMDEFCFQKVCAMVFTSNRFEGSTVNYRDTEKILSQYATLTWKEIINRVEKDISESDKHKNQRREVLRHYAAHLFLHSPENNLLSKELIKEAHKILMEGAIHEDLSEDLVLAGEWRQCGVSAGAGKFVAPSFELVPTYMDEFIDTVNYGLKNANVDGCLLAAYTASKFVDIHPFEDGNGRLSRLLTNFVLSRKGQPFAVFCTEKPYLKIITDIQQKFLGPKQKYEKAWCFFSKIVNGTWANFYNINQLTLPD